MLGAMLIWIIGESEIVGTSDIYGAVFIDGSSIEDTKVSGTSELYYSPSAIADAIEKDVPVPTLTTALFTRFRSRQEESFAEKMLAALRNAFGGHAVRR